MSYIAGWVALGVVLLLLEALFISGFFLSFATSAFLVSLIIYFHPLDPVTGLVVFSVFGLISVYPWKVVLGRLHKNQSNINDY